MSRSVTLTELGLADFRAAIGLFVAVYAAAMDPPERMLSGRESILERHAANPGFRALAAIAEDTDRGTREIAGFTYGFHGAHGQWWHDMVAGALASRETSPAEASTDRTSGTGARTTGANTDGARRDGTSTDGTGAARWLTDSFEVAELHVMPAYQGAGIGRSLLRRLLSPRPERTALLSTPDTESPARRLYRGVGFIDLLTGYRFVGGDPPYAVMGAELPLRPEIQRQETRPPGTQHPETQR